jgi:GMP synthase-like glutamine amidotransferase
MLPVAIFRFSPTETPGRFGIWLTQQGIPWELLALDEDVAVPASLADYSGIGMMGGPMSVNDKLPWVAPLCSLLRDAIGDGTPVIGHCLGAQLMAKALGARVKRMEQPEIGWLHVDVCDRGARREWFGGLPRFAAFQWHYDAFDLPPMATRILTNDVAVNQGFVIDDRHVGFQCHIEMTRELVESWCSTGGGELPARSSTHRQSAADLQSDLDARLAALGAVADGVYARWAQGLPR